MSEPGNVPTVAPAAAPRLPRGRRVWPMVLLAIVILVSGAAIGSGIMVLVLKDRVVRPPSPGEKAAQAITADMHERYRLTDEQADQVHEILARRMAAIENIRDEAQEKMTAEHDKLRAEMKAVLTPDQFGQWVARFDAMRPPPFGPPHGMPGGPHGGPPDPDRRMPGGPPDRDRPPPGGPPDHDRPPPGPPPQGAQPSQDHKGPPDHGPNDRGPGGDRPPPDGPGDKSKEPPDRS